MRFWENYCKHYDGKSVMAGDGLCKLGIDVRNLTGGDSFGIAKRFPCLRKNESSVVCGSRQWTSAEEATRIDRAFDEAVSELKEAREPLSVVRNIGQ